MKKKSKKITKEFKEQFMNKPKKDKLKIFISNQESKCNECWKNLGRRAWIILKINKGANCLKCAKLNRLVFLPSEDAALTRRSKKYSNIFAMILMIGLTGCGPSGLYEHAPGWGQMEHLELLPYLPPAGMQTVQSSAYDAGGGNVDGEFEATALRYIDENDELVIWDEEGPGCLYRMHLNHWLGALAERTLKFGKSHIRLYFDDETTPRFDMEVNKFFGGATPPFDGPLMHAEQLDPVNNPEQWLFSVGYYPFPFARRLKITLTPWPSFEPANEMEDIARWHQFTGILYPPDAVIESWSPQSTARKQAVVAQWERMGENPIQVDDTRLVRSVVTIAPGQSS
ncbi:MAG: DUF2961 domain-containing protein, partial [bacterium]|nr:DUF2961 domain-containing protein [bacterium]